MPDETLKPRIEALMRWLLDEGHITPMGVRQIQSVLDEAGAAPKDDDE